MQFDYDVVVIGGGHAGCEAAHASARLGVRTCLITMDMNKIGQMSCNPAVGGIAKGQIVREIDALGGKMGEVIDACSIQFRMLNRSKGPAMWSPRAQADRGKFIWEWRRVLENTDNLSIWQDTVTEFIFRPTPDSAPPLSPEQRGQKSSRVGRGIDTNRVGEEPSISVPEEKGLKIIGVKTQMDVIFMAKAVILTAGTFLNGLMHIGRTKIEGGRVAEPASYGLTEQLKSFGFETGRMKTGTPVRLDGRSIDFSLAERQDGDQTGKFSYLPRPNNSNHSLSLHNGGGSGSGSFLPCWTIQTNEAVHEILRAGLPDSPLYNGQIQSIGPRYCPSIETKLVTFADKDQHQLFLEPEGTNTQEYYLTGFSASLPIYLQISALRMIPAFRNLQVYRPGYAIEYDYFDPTQLKHSLESKNVDGLFLAGQVNGTTGYEEAGGQGIVAGMNAALKCAGSQPFTMHRDESYIGVLIDDLVIKGVDEPYRMFTSRAEYRILLRQDNADMRLTEKSFLLGLASTERMEVLRQKQERVGELLAFCEGFSVKAAHINPALEQMGETPLVRGCKLIDLIARPGITIDSLAPHIARLKEKIASLGDETGEVVEAAEIHVKYKGYIEREKQQAEKMMRLEGIRIKDHFDYASINSLSTEARQKLARINPETLGQASRIPGVSPSDVNVLLVLMNR